jgi:hypothetical protein
MRLVVLGAASILWFIAGMDRAGASTPPEESVAFAEGIADARAATPEQRLRLIKLVGTNNQEVVAMACFALRELQDASPPVLAALEKNLNAGANSEAKRSVSGFTLMALGDPGRAVLLRRAISAPSVLDRLAAVTALRADLAGLKNPELRSAMKGIFRDIEKADNPLPLPPSQDSPLSDGSFLKENFEADWKFETSNGGAGRASFDDGRSHGEGGSLRLEKTNANGEVSLRSARPLKIKAGTTPVVRLYFSSDDAPVASGLQIFFETAGGTLTMGDPVRGWVPLGQSLLRNQAPGQWSKRLIQAVKSDQDREVFVRIVLRGNPATVWLDDIGAPAPAYAYAQTVPTETLREPTLPAEPALPAEAVLQKEGDRVRLVIDGKPVPPILYTILRSSFGDYAGMEQLAEVRLMVSTVPFSDVVDERYPPAQPVWKSSGTFDFTTPLKWLDDAANKAPESRFVLNLHFCWPKDWVEQHPEEAWTDEAGLRGYGTSVHFKNFANELPAGLDARLPRSEAAEYRWWPSPFSESALRDAEDGIARFVAVLKTQPYANRVVGVHISGGHDLQFMTGNWPDYSPPAVKAFREWLGRRYGSDEALQKAWGDPSVTLGGVEIPRSADLLKFVKLNNNLFLDPVAGRRFVEHQQFQAEQGLRIRERLAAAFKREWARPAFAMTWQMGGGRGQGVEDVFLSSEAIDMLVPQPQYETRLPGHVGGLRSAPLESFALHGKMAIKELDLRTWLRMSGAEVQSFYLGAAMNPLQFRQIFRKEAAQMIAAGQGYWFLDLATSGYRDPEMLEAIADGARAYRELELNNPTPIRPDVALVWVDEAPYWMADYFKETSKLLGGTSVSILQTLERFTLSGLKQAGVPYDDIYLSDLLREGAAGKYKVLVFPDAFRLTDAQRKAIHEKLASGGRTLVWNYASGYVRDRDLSDTGVSDVTGMTVQSEAAPEFPRVRFIEAENTGSGVLSGLVGVGELAMNIMSEGVPDWKMPRGFRRFIVTDPNSVPLAAYEDGKVAVATRQFANWKSVYFGMLGTLDSKVLNRIAREAGARVLADTPVAVEFNGRFLSLHGMKNGPAVIHLPFESRVFDFDTGEEAAVGKDVTLSLDAGETLWFRVEPIQSSNAPLRDIQNEK